MNRAISYFVTLAAALACGGCWLSPELSAFTLHAARGPAGSLLVYGECAAPDGALLLIQARGGEAFGAQLESTILTPVVKKRYVADLGLFEPLHYRLQAVLSPAFNPSGVLPKRAYNFHDRALTIRDAAANWEIRREAMFRLGGADEEKSMLQRRVKTMADAQKTLERFAASLRELDERGRPGDLARWQRLFWENRRGTALETEGVDPLFPTLHAKLKEADDTLQRRFHGVLAKLTGARDELDKLDADWALVDQRLARAGDEIAALQAKLDSN
jgi:hypothetical protein